MLIGIDARFVSHRRKYLMPKISYRLDLVKAYFSPSRNFPFSMFDLVKGVIKLPCTHLAPVFIENINEANEYLVVKLRQLPIPLFWVRLRGFFLSEF